MDKIRINKEDIIANLINRSNIDLTLQRVAIYLNLTGIYLETSSSKNLFKVDLTNKNGAFYDSKRYLNSLFYPAILNTEDIKTVLSYLEYIPHDKAKRIKEDFIRNPEDNLIDKGFIYGILNKNNDLREYYELVEV